jgi:hypothetical protein
MMEVTPAKPTRILKITITDNIVAAKNFAYFINGYFINAVVNFVLKYSNYCMFTSVGIII